MTVPMVHVVWDYDWMEYFYEGELPVIGGRVEVPEDRPEWAQRLWMLGFTKDPEGNPIENPLTYFEQARDAKEQDASEGADAGGQSDVEDRLRSSAEEGRRSVPRRRVGSRSGNRSRSRA